MRKREKTVLSGEHTLPAVPRFGLVVARKPLKTLDSPIETRFSLFVGESLAATDQVRDVVVRRSSPRSLHARLQAAIAGEPRRCTDTPSVE